jgi:type IV secretory pathway TrbD component
MATIQYISYDFYKPCELAEMDYTTLKELLNDNSKLSITPASSAIARFKRELIVLGIGILCGYVTSFDVADWISLIFGVPAFIVGGVFLFSFAPSFITYIEFVFNKSRYYSKLKKDIIK